MSEETKNEEIQNNPTTQENQTTPKGSTSFNSRLTGDSCDLYTENNSKGKK